MLPLLAEISLRVTVLAAVCALVIWIVRVHKASVQHAAWVAVLFAMLALPLWTAWGPRATLTVLPEEPHVTFAPEFIASAPAPPQQSAPSQSDAPALPQNPRSWQFYALAAYFAGAGFLLLRLAAGTFYALRLLHTSTFEGGRRVHPACASPVTVGWLRPIVLLPVNWTEWSTQELEAVLAHERAHVRRRDPLFQWLALANRAIFWFHPLAWWLERKLAALSEHACDAAVLEEGHDPALYSRFLVMLARATQATGARVQVLGAAMPGPGLAQRIRSILTGVRETRISPARIALAAGLLAAAIVLTSAVRPVHAQQPLPKFEVASIKPAAPNADGRFIRLPDPGSGRISVTNFNLEELIRYAYNETTAEIKGGPKWISSDADSFDIEASAGANVARPEIRLMLRALLEERFALKIHKETREGPAYALVAARADRKLGEKMIDVTGKACAGGMPPPPDPLMPRCRATIAPIGMTVRGATLAQFAAMLSLPMTNLGRPVIDRSGIPGEFDIDFEFKMFGPDATPDAPSLFTALQEQLGLKLEPARASIETLVVDRAEKPTEN